MRRRYHLKNKKRFAALLMLLTLVIMFSGLVVNAGAAAQGEPPHKTILVEAGDTLWDIASRYAENSDPRAYIFELKQLNGIATDNIFIGQQLMLP
ncbi:MAG: LysM peptidoglycan-binding domain-containing protein [Clostridia bacterium]|nr:LysM peptidoglycan-binding domain-containing protein [Clostridia bacterium]